MSNTEGNPGMKDVLRRRDFLKAHREAFITAHNLYHLSDFMPKKKGKNKEKIRSYKKNHTILLLSADKLQLICMISRMLLNYCLSAQKMRQLKQLSGYSG